MSCYVDHQTFHELQDSEVLPAPSGVRLKIMQMCQQEDIALSDLVAQVQGDPILAGRLIQIANIPNINKGRMVAAVNIDLLLMVGLHAVRQMALAISLTESARRGDCQEFDYQRFWSRSTAMACAGQALGELLQVAPPAEMFTVALLADIGRLGLASARPRRYGELLRSGAQGTALRAQEKEVFGFHHLELAAAMMQDWLFPRLFCEAVLHHGAPEQSGLDEADRQQRLIRVLELAACVADLCVASDAERTSLLPRLLRLGGPVELPISTLASVCSHISQDWSQWGALLKVPARVLPDLGTELVAALKQPG
ncbi:Hdc superfamily two component response regulator protein [Herbaspirillum rubrisubalbicans M1]|uniref:HDOD domain-containing protein n=1 Tax=Herbaspirillum rubrisubalbicans TaxID=80842 RepID=UPI00073A3D91|nr:HDOD domain-containing protein [Herbaspirillum rubrisubalbicans]ALU89735.1 Hdc superfamily two component response regulator protein [Herbaspirillum rubrisubalbicans M1]